MLQHLRGTMLLHAQQVHKTVWRTLARAETTDYESPLCQEAAECCRVLVDSLGSSLRSAAAEEIAALLLSSLPTAVAAVKPEGGASAAKRRRPADAAAIGSEDDTYTAEQSNNSMHVVRHAEGRAALLELLHSLLITCGTKLNARTRLSIDRMLLEELGRVHPSEPAAALLPLVASSRCRSLLYSCLAASILVPSFGQAPPLSEAMYLLAAGVFDDNLEVSRRCRELVASCEAVLHPRLPALRRRLVDDSGDAADKQNDRHRPQAMSHHRQQQQHYHNHQLGHQHSSPQLPTQQPQQQQQVDAVSSFGFSRAVAGSAVETARPLDHAVNAASASLPNVAATAAVALSSSAASPAVPAPAPVVDVRPVAVATHTATTAPASTTTLPQPSAKATTPFSAPASQAPAAQAPAAAQVPTQTLTATPALKTPALPPALSAPPAPSAPPATASASATTKAMELDDLPDIDDADGPDSEDES